MSIERLGNVLPQRDEKRLTNGNAADGREPDAATGAALDGGGDADSEAVAFVRFCYRRRAVAWPELYDEMCAVAAHGDYRGMTYEQLEGLGIRFVLAALPRLAEMAARVIAEERGPQPVVAVA